MKKLTQSMVAVTMMVGGLLTVASPSMATTLKNCYYLFPNSPKATSAPVKQASCTTQPGAAATSGSSTFASILGNNKRGDRDLTSPTGVTLNFEGSSFVQPLITALDTTGGTPGTFWNPSNRVDFGNYTGQGSTYGRNNVTGGFLNVGFSDQPMTTANSANTVPTGVVASDYAQLPVALGGAVIAYDLGPALNGLHLSSAVIADIYMGTITLWTDSRIVNLNGGPNKGLGKKLMALPTQLRTIKPLTRNSGSGTTFAFTDYLNTANGGFPTGVTAGPSGSPLNSKGWAATMTPVAGNAGMATALSSVTGTIGYLEYSYLLVPYNNPMDVAMLQDKAGVWIQPSLTSIQNAANAGGTTITPDNFSIVYLQAAKNPKTTPVWPLATYSWAIIKKDQSANANAGTAAVRFLDWVIHYGQTQANSQGFVPLPFPVQNYGRHQLMKVTNGATVLLTAN
jgi:phosphate transport system substrate-binding protein